MPPWPGRADKRKRYFHTPDDIAHILVNEDGPVNCGRRCRRDALADAKVNHYRIRLQTSDRG